MYWGPIVKLVGAKSIPWSRPDGCPAGFETIEVTVGNSDIGGMALEVAVTKWSKRDAPTREALTRLHTLRTSKRATPVVLVVEFDSGGTLVFGPNSAAAPVGPLPAEQTQRVIQAALDEPTVVAARSRLAGLVQAIDSTSMPGIKNSGLFANHELRVGVPQRPDWKQACDTSTPLLTLKGKALIEKLGFQTGQFGAHALLLTGGGAKAEAIAVLLDEREAFDADSPRFTVSPVAYGLNMAEKQGVPWLILVRGSQIRLYSSRKDIGVGRKGLAETFFEVDLPQLTTSTSGYLQLIFSASALADGGSTYEILKSSAQYAVALGVRLRDKVYEEIIPGLSVAVANALSRNGIAMDSAGLDLAYQLTLRVFFRMLFQVYAEDRKLLPYGENAKYDRNALKTKAADMVGNPNEVFDAESTSIWDDLTQVWRVIDTGNISWGVPPYNGGLFASDVEFSEPGFLLSQISISDAVMGPALRSLLLEASEDGTIGQIDFRSLGVREFGTIYEGLLDSSLGLADVDLTLDEKQVWVPATEGTKVLARKGEVYFHNRSGQRKASGSYFTPSFVVEHLLEKSLDPALSRHLAKVGEMMQSGDHSAAAEKFFDFKVADLAMGSGHFLTSAIDHIEQRMASFLAEDGHSIPGVAAELLKLEMAAKSALGENFVELERSSLLRRQIARRCIYGLDVNPIAVELARVSIWIHTFVRGLPMSSLDHNLVCANSLTGVGSVDEALTVLSPGRKFGQHTVYDEEIQGALEKARDGLLDAFALVESNRDEAKSVSRANKKALKDSEIAHLVFDAALMARLGNGSRLLGLDASQIAKLMKQPEHVETVRQFMPAHMPVLFPEVFLRENGGFDVLLGNPPWKEVVPDEPRFWMRIRPRLRTLTGERRDTEIARLRMENTMLAQEFESERMSLEQIRKLLKATFDMGTGDADLSRAFAWRYWQLCRKDGCIGIVLPKTAFSAEGLESFRRTVLGEGGIENVVFCLNTKRWLFDIEPRYSVALAVLSKSKTDEICCSGPISSLDGFDERRNSVARFPVSVVLAMTESASIPVISDQRDADIMSQMRQSPSYWEVVGSETPFVSEFHATNDRKYFEKPDADDPIDVYSGKSFSHWISSTRDVFAVGSRRVIYSELQRKFDNQRRIRSTAYYGWTSKDTDGKLPIDRFRVAFAGVTNPTNARTSIAALIPPGIALTNICPYVAIKSGNEEMEAFLLGIMNSRVFDWYVRKFIETQMNLFFVRAFPVPKFDGRSIVHEIVRLSAELTCVSDTFSAWGTRIGVECKPLSDESVQTYTVRLDAAVALAYGLTTSQVSRIMATFHDTWDYAPHLERVLTAWDELKAIA